MAISPVLMIGGMLAFLHTPGNASWSIDFWYITVRMGAISTANSFGALGASWLGPIALFTCCCSHCRSFITPGVVMWSDGRSGYGLIPISGYSCIFSVVNTLTVSVTVQSRWWLWPWIHSLDTRYF